jgi:hypothetical protein
MIIARHLYRVQQYHLPCPLSDGPFVDSAVFFSLQAKQAEADRLHGLLAAWQKSEHHNATVR